MVTGATGRRVRGCRRGSGSCRASAAACPTTSWAANPARTSTISAETPTASVTRDDTASRTGSASSARRLGDDHDRLATLAPGRTERDHVPGPHPVDTGRGALDVFGEDVATADDDDVLQPAADDELAVHEVAEVTGAQPLVVEHLCGGPVVAEVPGRDRRSAHLELAGLAVAPRDPGAGLDDPQLQARDRPAEERQPARAGRRGSTGAA